LGHSRFAELFGKWRAWLARRHGNAPLRRSPCFVIDAASTQVIFHDGLGGATYFPSFERAEEAAYEARQIGKPARNDRGLIDGDGRSGI